MGPLIVLTIRAVVCGRERWEEIEMHSKEKHMSLEEFLSLPNGIPSHDIIRCLFIQRKTDRRTRDPMGGKSALHMITVWASENRMVLG